MNAPGTEIALVEKEPLRVHDVSKSINLTNAVIDREKALSEELLSVMNQYVVGQEAAKRAIVASVIKGMFNVNREQGVLGSVFLAGPTGVGKTEMARTLSRVFFGTPDGITKIPCDTMPHPADIARLVGSSAGYVGYGDTPHLADVRVHAGYKTAKEKGKLHPLLRNYEMENFSIVLVDEAEKCHPDVMNAFLGAIQTGEMQMSSGKESGKSRLTEISHSGTTDLRNALFIFTSNIGEHAIQKGKGSTMGFANSNSKNSHADDSVFEKEFKRHFPPEFIGRLDAVVRCDSISESDLRKILALNVAHINRILTEKGYYDCIRVSTTESYVETAFASAKKSSDYGARSIEGIVKTIGSQVGLALQSGRLPDEANGVIEFDVRNGQVDIQFVPTPAHVSEPYAQVSSEAPAFSKEGIRALVESRLSQHGDAVRDTVREYLHTISEYEPALKDVRNILENRLRGYGFKKEDVTALQTSTFLELYETTEQTSPGEFITRGGANFDPVGFRAIEKYVRVAVLKDFGLRSIYKTIKVLLKRPMTQNEAIVISQHIHRLLLAKGGK